MAMQRDVLVKICSFLRRYDVLCVMLTFKGLRLPQATREAIQKHAPYKVATDVFVYMKNRHYYLYHQPYYPSFESARAHVAEGGWSPGSYWRALIEFPFRFHIPAVRKMLARYRFQVDRTCKSLKGRTLRMGFYLPSGIRIELAGNGVVRVFGYEGLQEDALRKITQWICPLVERCQQSHF